MGLKTSGDTMQSPNNSSRRCAHVSVILSPTGFALPMVGAGREAIVFTARYVMQRGAKAGHTVGLWVLYTGMQWQCLPIPQDAQGKPAIHYTTVYKVFAKWAA